jgi:phosphoribosylanthranilate isomerase
MKDGKTEGRKDGKTERAAKREMTMSEGRTRVKICGLTRGEDAALAARLGADLVGVVFAESPRRVSVAQAREVLEAVPPRVGRVGVFAGHDAGFIVQAVQACGLRWVQLADGGDRRAVPNVRARVIRVVHEGDAGDAMNDHAGFGVAGAAGEWAVGDADAVLLDSAPGGPQRGGTGRRFDWSLARGASAAIKVPVLVAGGLTPENVGEAIATLRPWGVDVSSGVEARPGAKDPARLAAFFDAVRAADGRRADGRNDG